MEAEATPSEDVRFARKRRPDPGEAPEMGKGNPGYLRFHGKWHRYDHDKTRWVPLGEKELADFYKDERFRPAEEAAESALWKKLRALDPRPVYYPQAL